MSSPSQSLAPARWRALALGLLVGSFATNAVPHLFFGLAGQRFMTPFGADSSATVNIVWGLANVMLAAVIAAIPMTRRVPRWTVLGVAAGFSGTALSLWVLWR